MGWTESHSVLEPDYSRSTSSSESGGENGPGTADTSSNVGPHPGRAAPASHGYAPSALQSMRDEFMGKQLGDCPPLGDYPPEHGVPRQDRGARARHTARAEGGKAQGKPAEDRKGIGTRQRARPALGKAREPTKTGGKPTSDTPTVFRKERQPSPADEGPVTFDEEGIRRQGQEAEARRTALRPAERAGSPVKEEPVTAGPKAAKGGLLEKKKRKMEAAGSTEGKGPWKEGRVGPRDRSPPGADEVSSGKVRELLQWLTDNSGDHLTAAQMSQYVLLQAVTLNGPFAARELAETHLGAGHEGSKPHAAAPLARRHRGHGGSADQPKI